jgi:hypothetical protein
MLAALSHELLLIKVNDVFFNRVVRVVAFVLLF